MTEFPITAKGDADLAGFISSFAASSTVLATFAGAAATAATAGAALGVIALIPAVEAAADFQTEIIKLNTLVGISTEMMHEFEESILDLAPGLGQTPLELAKAMFAITSGGIRSAQSVDLLVASAQAARIGLGDVTTIARVSTAVLQAFADQNLSAAEAVDIMVGTVREGNLVAEELPNALGRVIGIAGQMGVTFQEVGTFMATFTRLGVSAEIAATSLRATLFALLNPGKEARDTFDEIGISVQQMRDNIRNDGLTDAMLGLLEATEGNLDTLSDIIPNIRAMSGVLGVYAAQADQVVEIQNNMNNIFGVTAEGFETVQETVSVSLANLSAGISTIAVTIGRFFLPPLEFAIDKLARLAEAINVAADVSFRFTDRLGATTARVFSGDLGRENVSDADKIAEKIIGFRAAAAEAPLETLMQLLKQIREQQKFIGEQQISKDSLLDSNELNFRNNLLHEQALVLQEVIDAFGDIQQIGGVDVTVPGEDAEAVEKLLARLREQLLIRQGLQRQLLEEELTTLNTTMAHRAAALAYFDEKIAIEELEKAQEALQKRQKEIDRIVERSTARRQREGQRIKDQMRRERERQATRDSALAVQLMVDSISRDMDRQEDLVRSTSDGMINALEDLIRKTSTVSEAFRDMVSNILIEFARLKFEDFLRPFLNDLFIPIPDQPGPTPFPDDPSLGLGIPDLTTAATVSANSIGRGGNTTIVQQSITFAPNLIDGRSGQAFIREQSGAIVKLIGDAARQSGDFAARLR